MAAVSAVVLDQAREKVLRGVGELKQAEAALTALGCINGFIHEKTGNKAGVKYIREAADAQGKRKFIYLGRDPAKIQEGQDKINRYHQRDRVRRAIEKLQRDLREFERELEAFMRDADSMVEDVAEYLQEAITEPVRAAMAAQVAPKPAERKAQTAKKAAAPKKPTAAKKPAAAKGQKGAPAAVRAPARSQRRAASTAAVAMR